MDLIKRVVRFTVKFNKLISSKYAQVTVNFQLVFFQLKILDFQSLKLNFIHHSECQKCILWI